MSSEIPRWSLFLGPPTPEGTQRLERLEEMMRNIPPRDFLEPQREIGRLTYTSDGGMPPGGWRFPATPDLRGLGGSTAHPRGYIFIFVPVPNSDRWRSQLVDATTLVPQRLWPQVGFARPAPQPSFQASRLMHYYAQDVVPVVSAARRTFVQIAPAA